MKKNLIKRVLYACVTSGVACLTALSFGRFVSAQTYMFATPTPSPIYAVPITTAINPIPLPTRDLSLGASGQDVANLQSWLMTNGYSIPSIAGGGAMGYFGMQTQSALESYQRAVGLPAYGYYGNLTRQSMNGSVGYGSSSFASGGSSGGYAGGGTTSGVPTGYSVYTTISPNGGEVWQTGTMQTIRWSVPTAVYNGIYVPANAVHQPIYADIRLEFPTPACALPTQPIRCMIAVRAPYLIVRGVDLTTGSYAWRVGAVTDLSGSNPTYAADGSYKIQICPTDGSACFESANTFAIASSQYVPGSGGSSLMPAPSSAGPLMITSPNGGEVWQAGTAHTITWVSPSYFRATTADLKLQRQITCSTAACPMIAYAPQTIAVNIPINQDAYIWTVGQIVGGATIADGTYTVQICVSGTTNCEESDQPFTITSVASQGNQCPSGYVCMPAGPIGTSYGSASAGYGNATSINQNSLLRVCPNVMIVSQTPSTGPNSVASQYYILNGIRRELSDFDTNWVSANCSVPVQNAY
ncbi:MAG: peptidoglycan-binding protein [Patescibacteria group bacterium]|nr:peptidoglycan-binding protein [Patescibacteria group bacterium]